jgi:hypothetical protein
MERSFLRKDGQGVTASMDNAKNADFPGQKAIEDHVLLGGKCPNVGILV